MHTKIKYIYNGISMDIAIFGGSFDPLHYGHLSIVKEATKQFNISKVIIIPAYVSPFKTKCHLQANIRYKMIKKVFCIFKKVFVSSFELNKKRAVSTYESVLFIRKRFNPRRLYVIVGADNIENIHLWSDYRKLKNKVTFIVVPRNNIRIKRKMKYKILKFSNENSSTNIRKFNIKKSIPTKARMLL